VQLKIQTMYNIYFLFLEKALAFDKRTKPMSAIMPYNCRVQYFFRATEFSLLRDDSSYTQTHVNKVFLTQTLICLYLNMYLNWVMLLQTAH